MRVKLIGVSNEARKSESVARATEHRHRLIATALVHISETVHRHCARHIKCGLAAVSSVNTFEWQMTLKEPAAEIPANLEYPVCSLCGSDRCEFPFCLRLEGDY